MSVNISDFLKNAGTFLKGRAPGQAIIQMTDHCNARCPQCGMRVQEKFQRHKLPDERLFAMIDRAAENGVNAISFTGGEPFLHMETLINCIKRSTERGIKFIRTGTNAYFLTGHEKPDFTDNVKRMAEKIAATELYTLWFSLDTWNAELHEECRGLKGVVKGMEKTLPIFADFGIYPSANLGINRNVAYGKTPEPTCAESEAEFRESYTEGFRRFYSFAESLGFTIVNACYPMSADGNTVYKAESADHIVKFSIKEKIELFTALFNAIPEYRSRLRIFTPRSSLLSLLRQYKGDMTADYGCRGGIDFFYIDAANGHAHPCGFREGEDMGAYENFEAKGFGMKAVCRKCDWECFRDPSTLLSPFTEFFEHPAGLISRIANDREFFRLWKEDIKYYSACGYFNGRKMPDLAKMSAFAPKIK